MPGSPGFSSSQASCLQGQLWFAHYYATRLRRQPVMTGTVPTDSSNDAHCLLASAQTLCHARSIQPNHCTRICLRREILRRGHACRLAPYHPRGSFAGPSLLSFQFISPARMTSAPLSSSSIRSTCRHSQVHQACRSCSQKSDAIRMHTSGLMKKCTGRHAQAAVGSSAVKAF